MVYLVLEFKEKKQIFVKVERDNVDFFIFRQKPAAAGRSAQLRASDIFFVRAL